MRARRAALLDPTPSFPHDLALKSAVRAPRPRRVMTAALVSALTSGAFVAPTVANATLRVAPAAAESTEGYGATRIAWGACEDPQLQAAQAECGSLAVPLDYTKPTGQKISLAVSRVRHTVSAENYQGVMLVNPGGPGTSGLWFSAFGSFIPDGAGAAYDWIGFDPRGVGSSTPSVSCDPEYLTETRPDYRPLTKNTKIAWRTRASEYAADCDRGGELLDHMKTTDTARDMDQLRKALGQRKINYLGFSYGTYLGQVYATMYPQRVRRMVFDSTVDPTTVWYQGNLNQNLAIEKVLNRFFDWTARNNNTYGLGTTASAVRKRWSSELNTISAAPIGTVGPAEWTDLFVPAAYSQSTWPALADGLSRWVNERDGETVEALYAQFANSDENAYAAYLATSCTDATWPAQWSTWQANAQRSATRAPFFTWANTWFNAPCQAWPAKAGKPVTVNGTKAPAILMIGETLDAATPYSGSLTVRELFPKARLIEVTGGTNHAGSLRGNTCVDHRIADYLATGALPQRRKGARADVQCAPLPEPSAATAQTTAVAKSADPFSLRELVAPQQ
ncbi:MAG: alpha/beta hydrolase [Actinomycetota bacterium]